MLFNGYRKEEDVFYQNQLTVYPRAELDIIERTCLNLPVKQLLPCEILIRRLLHSAYFSLNDPINNKDIICLLLLHIPYITHPALKRLHIFSSEAAGKRFISRYAYTEKNRKGFLKSFNLTGNTVRRAYTLTTSGRAYAKSLLPPAYVEKYISNTSSLSGNQHDVSIINLFYRLINDLDFPYFRWYPSPFIKKGADIGDALKQRGISEKDETGLRPDAVINNVEEPEKYIFVEQDMNTEKGNALIDKFNKYADFFSTIPLEDLGCYQIFFSIYTEKPRIHSIFSNGKDKSISKLKRIQNELMKFIANMDSTGESEITIAQVKNTLSNRLKNQQLKVKYPAAFNSFVQINAVLDEIISENNSASSIKDIEDYFNKHIEQERGISVTINNWNASNIQRKRMNSIREAVALSELKEYLLNGVSLIGANCNNLDNMSGLFPEEYSRSHIKKYALPAINQYVFKKNNIDYEYDSVLQIPADKKDCILKHCYTMKNMENIHLVFENISDDIGGELRIRKLLSHRNVDAGQKLYLFLLVFSTDDAIQFNSSFTIPLNEIFGKRAHNATTNVTMSEQTIYINYMNYTDKGLSHPYTIEYNGSIVYYDK